jgi:eukaryotic-like serine/threonine-protein kinase
MTLGGLGAKARSVPGLVGREIGGYRILALVGEGGMGEVYRAEHVASGRVVALKLLRRSLLMSAEGRARFEREGRAAASLDHPAIATVHEVGEAGGQPFIAMEYVQGEALDAWLARPGLTLPQVLRALEQLAEALADAHAKGVVHRDLKPANVVVLPSGAVKLLDFGLAKLVQDDETDSGVRSQLITRPGGVIGTSAYMSPEQARGQRLDRRTDVFSFGVILFEALAGVPPFRGESGIEAVSGVLRDDPLPVLRDRPGLDPELVRMTEKALRKDPAERYQHMDDVAVDLRAARRALESSTTGRGAPLRSVWPWIITGAAAGVMLAALLFTQRGARAPLLAEGTLRLRPLTFEGRNRAPALSPAGDAVVFSSSRGGGFDLFVQQVESGGVKRLTEEPGDETDPVFSPRGDAVAYAGAEGRVSVVPLAGGKAKVLAAGGAQPAWSPDGTSIAFRRGTAIVVVPAAGGAERTLTPAGAAPAVGGLTWSPDGAWVVFVSRTDGRRTLARVPASGGPVVPMSEEPLDVREPFWSPDGRWLLATTSVGDLGDELWAVPVQRSGRVDGPPTRLLAGVGSYSHPTLSASRRRLGFAVRTVEATIERLGLGDAQDRGPEPVAIEGRVHDVQPAHGAGTLAVVVDGPGHPALATADASGKAVRLIDTPDAAVQPAFSPDDRTLAFVLAGPEGERLATLPLAGGRFTLLGAAGQRAAHPSWSPEGGRLAFASLSAPTASLRVIDAGGGNERTLLETPHAPGRSSWSPDGRWIALTLVDHAGQASVGIVSAEGGPLRPLLAGASAPLWLADGRIVFVRRDGAAGADLWSVRVDPDLTLTPGSERRLTTLGPRRAVDAVRGASTDGRHLYFRVVAVTDEQVWLGEVR